MCILSVHTLLKVVGYYDLSVLSMSKMGFQKKKFWMGVRSIQVFLLDIWNFFNFTKHVMQSHILPLSLPHVPYVSPTIPLSHCPYFSVSSAITS